MKKTFKVTIAILAILILISGVTMEFLREKGEIPSLQPHQYNREIENRINNLSILFIPFTATTLFLIVYLLFDIFKFLTSKAIEGKTYKVIIITLLKASAFYFILRAQLTVADAEMLMAKYSFIIVPSYRLIMAYIYVLGIIAGSYFIAHTIQRDYQREVEKAKNQNQEHYDRFQGLKNILRNK